MGKKTRLKKGYKKADRVIAKFIDYFFLYLLILLVLAILTVLLNNNPDNKFLIIVTYIGIKTPYLGLFLFFTLEAVLVSKLGSTLGKKLLNLYVLSDKVEKLSFGRSFYRTLSSIGMLIGPKRSSANKTDSNWDIKGVVFYKRMNIKSRTEIGILILIVEIIVWIIAITNLM